MVAMRCRALISLIMELSGELISLANEGAMKCDDDQCLILYGLVHDSACRIKGAAQQRYLGSATCCVHGSTDTRTVNANG